MTSTLRQLAELLDPRQKRRFVGLAIFGGCNAVLEAFGAGLLYLLIGTLVESGESVSSGSVERIRNGLPEMSTTSFVYVMAGLTGVFFLVKNTSSMVEIWKRNSWANREAANMASRLFTQYLHMPMAFHHQTQSSELTRTALGATDLTYRVTLTALASLISETMATCALLAILLLAAPELTPFVLVGLGATVFVLYRSVRRHLDQWGEEGQVLVADAYRYMTEGLGGIRETKLLGAESFFVSRFSRAKGRNAQLAAQSTTLSQASRLVLETLFVGAMIAMVIVLTVSDAPASQATSTLAIFAYAGFRLMPSANRVLQAMADLQSGRAAISLIGDDVRAAAAQGAASSVSTAAVEPLPFERAIVADHVTYAFHEGATPALSDVSFTVAKGATVGIVGRSGAGKSTLVDILSGLLSPDSGRVEVDGFDVHDDLGRWSRQIGYVSQTAFLRDATLRENIAFAIEPSEIDDEAVEEALNLAQLGPFVDSLPLGIETEVGESGVRLSGGQRQRVAIARALYRRPAVLIFDEATSALDTRTEAELSRAIESLAGQRTLIIVAHRLSTVRRCDQIFCFENGHLVGGGTFDELSSEDGLFRHLLTGDAVQAS